MRNELRALGIAILTAMTTWSGLSTASAFAATSSVTLSTDTKGLIFVSEAANTDGTVTDTWKDSTGWTFIYTGPPGAQVSVSKSGDPSSGTLNLSATNPTTPDTNGIVNSWCVRAISGSYYRISGCDVRTALQRRSGNNYIADDMQSQGYARSFTGLTQDSIWMTYKWTGNQVVHMDPLSSVANDCRTQVFGVSWFGVGFTSSDFTCGGAMFPFGLSSSSAGASWYGNARGGEVIGIEPIIQTHAPGSINPYSTLFLHAAWG